MKDLMGCLGVLIGIPLVLVLLYFVGGAVLFLIYALFHIILYLLPVFVMAAIILLLPYLAYQFYKGFIS